MRKFLVQAIVRKDGLVAFSNIDVEAESFTEAGERVMEMFDGFRLTIQNIEEL